MINHTIRLDIDIALFQSALSDRILASPMIGLPQLIISIITEQFVKQLRTLTASGEILRFKTNFIPSSSGSPDAHLPAKRWPPQPSRIQLPRFLKNMPHNSIIDLGMFEFTVTTSNDSPAIHFENPINLFCSKPLVIKQKSLKTITRYTVRIGYWEPIGLRTNIFTAITNAFNSSCECRPDYLSAYIDGVWQWDIRFICKICGKSYFCDCFKPALEKHYLKAIQVKNQYSEDAWPHKFIATYQKSQFKRNICHLCRDIHSDLRYCHPMYGSNTKVHYGPYIKKLSIEKDIDEAEAENEIRDILGIPRINEGWVSETELLNIVRRILPDNEVIHQASPKWLGRQRLDIFIPELLLAIEYQGLQHYQPVTYFGGEDGFNKTKERDTLKAKLCTANDVVLVTFRYDEQITTDLVSTRLRESMGKFVKSPQTRLRGKC